MPLLRQLCMVPGETERYLAATSVVIQGVSFSKLLMLITPKSKCVQMDSDEIRLSACKVLICQRAKTSYHHSLNTGLGQNQIL